MIFHLSSPVSLSLQFHLFPSAFLSSCSMTLWIYADRYCHHLLNFLFKDFPFFIQSLFLSGWSCHLTSLSADPDVVAATRSCLGNVLVGSGIQPSSGDGCDLHALIRSHCPGQGSVRVDYEVFSLAHGIFSTFVCSFLTRVEIEKSDQYWCLWKRNEKF